MIDNSSIKDAENRVKEMNRMTRQFLEQSNRYINPPKAGQNVNFPRNSTSQPSQQPQNFSSEGNLIHNNSINNIPQNNNQRNNIPINPPMQNNFSRQRQPPRPTPRFEQMKKEPAAVEIPPTVDKPTEHGKGQTMPFELPFKIDFALDNEKLLIIFIMVLLIKEKADMKLIVALAYLLF